MGLELQGGAKLGHMKKYKITSKKKRNLDTQGFVNVCG